MCVPWFRPLRDWLQGACVLCGIARGVPDFCAACRDDFLASRPRCARCAMPLAVATAACGACLHRPPHFDATLAVADYAPPIDALVLALKFGHRLELAPVLGALLADRAAAHLAAPDALVPLPLSLERAAERGFNQSLEIARAIARRLDWPLDPRLLVRTRHATAQASLRLDARHRNIRGAFAVRHAVGGRHVAVVDDVLTSGSTLDETARVLKAAGAARVTNLVVARTP